MDVNHVISALCILFNSFLKELNIIINHVISALCILFNSFLKELNIHVNHVISALCILLKELNINFNFKYNINYRLYLILCAIIDGCKSCNISIVHII
jgi:hypothetical protein